MKLYTALASLLLACLLILYGPWHQLWVYGRALAYQATGKSNLAQAVSSITLHSTKDITDIEFVEEDKDLRRIQIRVLGMQTAENLAVPADYLRIELKSLQGKQEWPDIVVNYAGEQGQVVRRLIYTPKQYQHGPTLEGVQQVWLLAQRYRAEHAQSVQMQYPGNDQNQ